MGSSSMEDLLKLCEYEKSVQDEVSQLPNSKIKYDYYQNLKADTLVLESCEDYMFHPINVYHSLTRVSKYLSNLVKLPKLYKKSLADTIMTESQAAQGLINIQDFHDVNVMDIANG